MRSNNYNSQKDENKYACELHYKNISSQGTKPHQQCAFSEMANMSRILNIRSHHMPQRLIRISGAFWCAYLLSLMLVPSQLGQTIDQELQQLKDDIGNP